MQRLLHELHSSEPTLHALNNTHSDCSVNLVMKVKIKNTVKMTRKIVLVVGVGIDEDSVMINLWFFSLNPEHYHLS